MAKAKRRARRAGGSTLTGDMRSAKGNSHARCSRPCWTGTQPSPGCSGWAKAEPPALALLRGVRHSPACTPQSSTGQAGSCGCHRPSASLLTRELVQSVPRVTRKCVCWRLLNPSSPAVAAHSYPLPGVGKGWECFRAKQSAPCLTLSQSAVGLLKYFSPCRGSPHTKSKV